MKSQKLLLALSLLLSTATTARAAEEGELCWEKCFRVMAGSHYAENLLRPAIGSQLLVIIFYSNQQQSRRL